MTLFHQMNDSLGCKNYVKFTYYFVCSFITVLGVEPRHCAYWGGGRPLGSILTTTHIEFKNVKM